MVVGLTHFSLPPINENQTSISGTKLVGGASFNKGHPHVKFSIPAQDRLLKTNEMYLTGQIVVMNSDGTTLQMPATNIENNNGINLTKQANLNWSNWGGISNVVERIFVQSKKSSVELMTTNNYSMYQNLKAGYANNENDFLVSPLTRMGASGVNAGAVNRRQVVMPNASHTTGGRFTNLDNFNDNNFGQFFSFKLDTSLLNNATPLHLGQDHLGGLLVTIELKNDNGFYFQRFANLGDNQATAPIAGQYYVLKNLRLEGRYIVPHDGEHGSNVVPLAERVNLINDVNSSHSANTYTPQLNQVKAFVNEYLDDDQQNNIAQNQDSYRVPLGLKSYTQQKNSQRTPEDFVISLEPNALTNSTPNAQSASNANTLTVDQSTMEAKVAYQGDAELRSRFQRALLDGRLAGHSSATLQLTEASLESDFSAFADANNGFYNQTTPDLLGVGLDYTMGLGMTSGYMNQDYTVVLNAGVNAGSSGIGAKLPANRREKSELQQTFVRNVAELDCVNLVKSQ